AKSGEADAAALRRDMADVARGLEAVVVGGAPPVAVFIDQTAVIEAWMAAPRAHVAMGRPGDERGRLRHHRIMPDDLRMRGKLAQRDRGADLDRVRIGLDGAQLRDVVDVDQRRRGDDAAPDIDHEIGAAAEQLAAGMIGARLDHLVERARTQQIELRQRIHQTAGPLPRIGLARRRFSLLVNTVSGVAGRSLSRPPVASAMALVSAGRNAASDPSPASLAPNGPCGSLLSTMPTSIGGESWMVGTR